MVRSLPTHTQDLIPNQRQQTWTRLIAIIFGVLYVHFHSGVTATYQTWYVGIILIYIGWQVYTLLNISRRPLCTVRLIVSPILDALLITIGIIVDGGQHSGIFLFYFMMMMSNGIRFGDSILLYAQTLALLSFLFSCAFSYYILQQTLDFPLLLLQVLSLIVIPYYIYIVSRHARVSFHEKEKAKESAFGFLNHSPIPVFIFEQINQDVPHITYVNTAMQQVYCKDATRLVGEKVDIIALMEDRHEVTQACLKSFTSPLIESQQFYIRGRNSHGALLQMIGQSSNLDIHGKTVGICFLLDITKNESMRSEMQKNMHDGHMSTLVAGIVHDFRNVLTSVIGTAEVMQFTVEDQDIARQLGLIIDAGERGSNMITHLLTLNTPNEGDKSIDSQAMHQSLTSITNLLRVQLPAHIQLHLDVEKNLPSIAINPTQLEQILMNLIKNATESMQTAGCINIRLYTDMHHKLAAHDAPALHICVSDEGKGIAAEDIPKVTKTFWTSRSKEGGTGLGLAMVQRIVRNHRGEFDIQSTLGKGTQINITFPPMLAEPRAEGSQTEDSQEETGLPLEHEVSLAPNSIEKATTPTPQSNSEEVPQNIKPWRILLVDDSPEVLHVHQHFLERIGLQVTTAESGEAALILFQQAIKEKDKAFDMLVTDFRMPGMDGMDLSNLIYQYNAQLPILMITAYADAKKLQQGSALPIEILSKPTSYKKIKKVVSEIQQA
ncbi:MAG: ATP-binding protein [Mariprofundaceae bacterium]|nr:ATP-binding protein [Mariprofundaceae bacterium]